MNKCIFMGTITKKGFETKPYNSQNGQGTMAKFSIGIYEGKDAQGNSKTTYVSCTAFGKTAEMLLKHFTPGKAIMIEATYTNRKYTKQDGTEAYMQGFNVDKVHFVPKEFDNNQVAITNGYNQNNVSNNGAYMVNQADMPTQPQNNNNNYAGVGAGQAGGDWF